MSADVNLTTSKSLERLNTAAETGSISPDTKSLLASAEAVLHLLERQAELARFEARKLELIAAMATAQQGFTEPLRLWLQSNGSYVAIDSTALTRESGWEKIRQISAQRLKSIQAAPAAKLFIASNQSVAVDLPPTEASRLKGPPLEVSKPTTDRKADASKERPFVLPTQPKVKDSKDGANSSELGHSKRRWKLSGVLVSAVLHLLLIIGLGIITVSVPIDSSIFELQASEPSEVATDSLEMTGELAAEAPSEQFETATSQAQPDLASSLATQGVTSTDVLSALATNSESSQLTQALAATSSQSPKNLTASFYGASATGNCFCYLIDGSATLRGSPWEAARAELVKSLTSLSEKQRFYVIFYNKVISKVPDRETGKPARFPIYATAENLQHAVLWLQSLSVDTAPAGGNHATVLEQAIDLEPDAIFMLTDGEMSPGVERQLLQILHDVNCVSDIVQGDVIRVPIHTIAFHSLDGVAVMKRIAEQNNGKMTFVPKPPEVESFRKRRDR